MNKKREELNNSKDFRVKKYETSKGVPCSCGNILYEVTDMGFTVICTKCRKEYNN